MKQIVVIVDTFKTSRPIFKLKVSSDEKTLHLNVGNPVYKYRPSISTKISSLETLVVERFEESFDSENGTFLLNRESIIKAAMSDVRRLIGVFIENNLDMKNPRQSKLFRWSHRNMPNTDEYNDTLVAIFQYMREHSQINMKCLNKAHRENILALLTAMEEKSGE